MHDWVLRIIDFVLITLIFIYFYCDDLIFLILDACLVMSHLCLFYLNLLTNKCNILTIFILYILLISMAQPFFCSAISCTVRFNFILCDFHLSCYLQFDCCVCRIYTNTSGFVVVLSSGFFPSRSFLRHYLGLRRALRPINIHRHSNGLSDLQI